MGPFWVPGQVSYPVATTLMHHNWFENMRSWQRVESWDCQEKQQWHYVMETWSLYTGATALGIQGAKPSLLVRPPGELAGGGVGCCEINHPFKTRQNTTITANLGSSHLNHQMSFIIAFPSSQAGCKKREISEFERFEYVCGCEHTHACVCCTPSISSPFLEEFSLWPLEVFPFHMVAAVQFVRLLFIPTWADPLHFLHINSENYSIKDLLFLRLE